MPTANHIEVNPITGAQTWPLRLAVLRPNRPLAAAQFPGDDDPTTKHFGALRQGRIVGIVSLFAVPWGQQPNARALQLRGMATAPEVRGLGYGCALVCACVQFAGDTAHSLMWCNARTSAVGFYRKLGWLVEGGEFGIPDVGPHYLMWRGVSGG